MSKHPLAVSRAVRIWLLLGLASASLVGIAASSQAATTEAKLSLSPSTGPALTATVVSVTGTGFADSGGTTVATQVSYESAKTCPVTPGANLDSDPTVVSATRMTTTVPSSLDLRPARRRRSGSASTAPRPPCSAVPTSPCTRRRPSPRSPRPAG